MLDSPPLDPDATMALELDLLDTAIREGGPPAVRFYRWGTPTLSYGRNLLLPDGSEERCAAEGVATVKRPTGGGAVLHEDDLTYAVVAPDRGGVMDCYRWVAGALIAGFSRLGIDAEITRHGPSTIAADCFAAPTGADLQVAGRKICGSAQLRRGNWFLQHGSIPIADLRDKTAFLLGTPVNRSSTFLHELAPTAGFEELAAALEFGFEQLFGSPALAKSRGLV